MTGSDDGKEKAQYFITQEVPPKCNYMYPQYWNIPLGFLAGETSVPNSRCHGARDDTKTYVCIYIDGVCVHWMPVSMQRCHVWRLQSATSSCMTCGFSQRTLTVCGVARSDCCSVVQSCDCSGAKRTVSMLATLLFRMSVSLKNCIIHRRRACLYMLSTTEGARRAMQV